MNRLAARAVPGVVAGIPLSAAFLIMLASVSSHAAQRQIATTIEEIVVTAQKREENLSDVPIAVSALDAVGIERTIARDLQDIQDMSPNIMIDPVLGNGTISFMSRGINMDDVEQSFDPAIGVVVDGLYIGTGTGSLMHLWDVERVEMLRGPQGTLFGKNTIGGVLNIRHTRPRGELGGKIAVNAGSYGRLDVKGVLHLPAIFNETLATKVSFVRLDGGGYFENIERDKDEGDEDFIGFGIALQWTPNDRFDALLSYNRDESDTDTRPVTSLSQSVNRNPDAATTITGQPACVFEPASCDHPYTDTKFHRDTRTTRFQPAKLNTNIAILEMNWDFADNHKLVSLTGWRDFDEEAIQEFDGYTFDLFYTNRPQTNEQFSQELRVESDWSERLKSVFGVFYWDRNYEINQQTYFTPLFFGLPPGEAIEVANGFDQIQTTESWSIFGQVEFNITDALTVTVGGRFIDEKKDTCGGIGVGPQDARIYDPTIVPGTGLYGNCDGKRPAEAIANSSNVYTDPETGALIPQTGKKSWDDFTPRVALSYQFETGALLYASYTEGFRSGGFNGRSTNAFDHGPYAPENVESIEFGFKSTFLEDRMMLNTALFFTKYTDKQEEVVFPALGGAGTVTIVENVGKTQINGFELELRWIPIDGLTLNANYGYLDAKFKNYDIPFLSGSCTVADPCTRTGTIDKTRLKLRRTPKHNYVIGAMYEMQLGSSSNFLIGKINYRWRDDYFASGNNSAESFINSFGILNASVHLEVGEHWRVSLYGKNLSNEEYLLHVLDVGTSFVPASSLPAGTAPAGYSGNDAVRNSLGIWSFGTVSPPRTWGLEVQYDF